MRGPATHFEGSHGPVNSGAGAQNISIYQEIRDSAAPDRSGRNPRRAAAEELRGLRRRFVPTPGCARARQLLEEQRTVLLSARPGQGACTAAMALLCELPQGAERFRELVDQAEEEHGTDQALDPAQVEEGAAFLLDLSGTTRRRYTAFMTELPGFVQVVRDRDAWLAVVLPQEWQTGFDPLLQRLTARLERPDPVQVLGTHLRECGIRPEPSQLSGKELGHLLAGATLAEVVELSEEIRAAREKAPGESGFSAWLDVAMAARAPELRDVDNHMDDLESGAQRALLLATALLHEARADTIHEAAIRLLHVTEHPQVTTPPLQQRTLTARLREIRATRGADGRVRFDTSGYQERVRAWFWDNYPQLRAPLGNWMDGAADLPALGTADRLALVTRFARECLRTGPPEVLSGPAERWTRAGAPAETLSMAARALAEGVVDPRHGSAFRHRLYVWSQDAALPTSRAHVLIGVCSEVLSRRFPDQAMVRLRHLSRHQHPDVRRTAREALSRITASDDRLYRSLLRRLRVAHDTRGWRDLAVFLQVADPSRLPDDVPWRTLLAGHWATAFAALPPDAWEESLRGWLNQVCSQPAASRLALSSLAAACARHRAAFGTVYAIACAWAGGVPERVRTVDALWASCRSVAASPAG
ncbi:hypothetical protein [Streptomyces qinglanensis]|uniref:hypothetical protein n=1 Tax=Streptomyces qinglanensis TaxID=943816 RepID=UPI003D741F52